MTSARLRLRALTSRTRISPTERDLLPYPVPAPEDRQGIAIATVMKDEEDFVEEWVDVHARLGVRHFYVYDNGSTDGTNARLLSGDYRDRVTIIPWRSFHVSPQILAHNHALANFGAHYRWIGFFDVDEFVFPLTGSSLDEALAPYEDLPVLALPWHMFGTSGHDTRPAGNVIDHFTERAVFPPSMERRSLLNWKLFVDPSRVDLMKVHEARIAGVGFQLINEDQIRFSPREKRDPQYAVKRRLQLNHYYTRAKEDLENKIAKGTVSKAGQNRDAGARRRAQAEAIEQATEIDITLQGLLKRLGEMP